MPDMPAFPADPAGLVAFFEEHGRDCLPGLLGIRVVELAHGRAVLQLEIERKHLASNGYLHAGTVVTLADTAAGYGTVASLPARASGFTTLELKSNHTATALAGGLQASAVLAQGGRTTQVWDVNVSADQTGRDIAYFRCTQMILYPANT